MNSDDFDSDVFDSEDDASQRETEGGDDKDSSEDELELHGNFLFSSSSIWDFRVYPFLKFRLSLFIGFSDRE